MQCPHCLEHFTPKPFSTSIGQDYTGYWWVVTNTCANVQCGRVIIYLKRSQGSSGRHVPNPIGPGPKPYPTGNVEQIQVYPTAIYGSPVPSEVPNEFAEDYNEARMVVAHSPKASAALSRRCLQLILEKVAEVKPDNLNREIDEVLKSGDLTSDVAKDLTYVRDIGNFAAHAKADKRTGEIVPVAQHEAEWCIDVIAILFDHYFVRPGVVGRRREELNRKRTEAGYQPLPP